MKKILALCAIVLLSVLSDIAAAQPATGYWWNSTEPGHGYVIEVQGTTMFFAGFLYDVSGRATWVASNGPMTGTTQYSGSLYAYSGGQTLNGTYQPATQGGAVGTVSLNFTSDTQATLVWPEGTIPIQRFDFGPGGSEATQPSTNPQTGYWWNSGQGGRGYTIEVQGGSMYFAAYMYDTNGNPIWYLASGPMSTNSNSSQFFQGDLVQYGNGQTLTGTFQAASVVNANVGMVNLQFTDTTDATLTLPDGTQIALIRYNFGGSTTTSTTQNVAPLVVTLGPNQNSEDVSYVSVTICAPGTSNCQTIDNIDVDTGSSGLRIISSVLNPSLASALVQQTNTSGGAVVECTQFADGYTWGPVKLADLTIAGESVKSLPMQVIGDPTYSSKVPNDCSNTGPAENTVATFGANGIIGVGNFQADCGAGCVEAPPPPGTYYSCSSSNCTDATDALNTQVQNPVGLFASDNNGVLIQLPAIPAAGQATATGSLIFGIGTQTNNSLGSAKVLPVDPETGYLTAIYEGGFYDQSFVDSGSSVYFLPSGVAQECSGSDLSGYFCPASTINLSVTLQGYNGSGSSATTISIANTQTLFSGTTEFSAFNDIGAENSISSSFDFGLPFFFGRNIFTAIENKSTPGGTGPFVAF